MESLNILFTSVGRRVSLVRHFQKLIKELRLEGMVAGVDVFADAPAFHVVDCALTICRIDDPDYIPQLLHICKVNNINLLFPLIDTDLLLLAENKEAFQAIGTTVVVSAPRL
ncbi:MAG: hypothetical protein GY868_01905, partial [Deltaproteobacteria bacterium]|nr:hypothetical protein [Deltaproteobacteria bacterium]